MQLFLRILVATFLCSSRLGTGSPTLPEKIHQTDASARELASKLSEEDKRGVLVLDLHTAEGRWLPFGAWLADQFSASLVSLGQGIQIIDRVKVKAALDALRLLPQDESDFKNDVALSKAVGANTLIVGSYGAAENGIGITLVVFRVSEVGIPESKSLILETWRGKIDLTDDLASHLAVPLDSVRPRDGIALAGVGGVTVPICIKCTPPPRMSVPDIDIVGLLREKHGAGTLQLKFVVTAEGHTSEITVSRPIGYGFDEQYVKAARDFVFKPAVDADNHPVSALWQMTFNINFK
jgi:hypothetical protein